MWQLSSTEKGRRCGRGENSCVCFNVRAAGRLRKAETGSKSRITLMMNTNLCLLWLHILCSLFGPNWIEKQTVTLLLAWQWKIDHTGLSESHIAVSSTNKWGLTRHTKVDLKCLICTTTLPFSSLSPLSPHTHSMQCFVYTVWCHHTNLAQQFRPRAPTFMESRASSARCLFVSVPYWNTVLTCAVHL